MEIYSKHGIQIECNPINCRELKIKSSIDFELFLEDKKIIAVEADKYKLQIGDTINIIISDRKYNYIVDHIYHVSPKLINISSMKRNKATIYLFPILRINTEDKVYFESNFYLMNLYVDKSFNLITLYRFFPHPQYSNLEDRIFKHPYYAGLEELEGGYVSFKFKIPDTCKRDVELFLDGKYSLLSDTLVKQIISFNKIDRNNQNEVLAIISKADWYKKKLEADLAITLDDDCELESKPDLKEELWEYLDIAKKRELS
jgi:hypothetical protein